VAPNIKAMQLAASDVIQAAEHRLSGRPSHSTGGSAFFEFAGKKYPKSKYRFTLQGSAFLAIAGLWREGEGNQPPSFTMLTTEPGPDVAPIHDRQIVILKPVDWNHWLDLPKPEQELLDLSLYILTFASLIQAVVYMSSPSTHIPQMHHERFRSKRLVDIWIPPPLDEASLFRMMGSLQSPER
jgi:hypothetical protein